VIPKPATNRASRIVLVAVSLVVASFATGETFRIGDYNVENYLLHASGTRHIKSGEARAKVQEGILAMRPDVIALEEIGGMEALAELQSSLKEKGLDLSHSELVHGYDTNIQVAVLSRFPLVASRSHTNDAYLLNGKKFNVSRGFAEVDVQVSSNFVFTLVAAHLKSKRAVPYGDESELRLEEAKILRQHINRLLALPNQRFIVLGDLNDDKNSAPIKEIMGGRGRNHLIDTRPAEPGDLEDKAVSPSMRSREICWTHYFVDQDLYSRIDYILLSPEMAHHWVTNQTQIVKIPGWGIGSDHRPLLTVFNTD
jgi:endonuclease/exonuclease/phosphatase family metal-dependent hydrolase